MTHEQVATLTEGAQVWVPRYQASGIRGNVGMATANFIRIDWIDSNRSYDVLRRTSPLWFVVERLP
jgi:hypothetical protein